MLARRRNLMLARARRAVGRKGRVALAGALTGAGKFLSNKAQNYVRRKLTNKKSSFQNVKVEGNGGQISRTTMGAKSSKSREFFCIGFKIFRFGDDSVHRKGFNHILKEFLSPGFSKK